jgi:hypothetical protein
MKPADTHITTAELRAAFGRARLLRFHGWTFDRAMAVPVLRWALERSAIARRQSENHPAQPRLI